MDSFYIFQYSPNAKDKNNFTLVIFCSLKTINQSVLRGKLKEFFESNRPPKKVIVIAGEYLRGELSKIFIENRDNIFDVIPQFLSGRDDIQLVVFDAAGKFSSLDDSEIEHEEYLIREGIYNIFRIREGLIRAASDNYHFIFPSGKHSPLFIRAGNILIHSAEICFIAVQLLKYLKPTITTIYCDTSSINSLAFALIELKGLFISNYHPPSIISFSSYDKFETFDFRNSKNSLIIISASTSGRLVNELLDAHPSLKRENVLSLFYLSDKETPSQIICNLTHDSKSFPDGIPTSGMYDNETDCVMCTTGSYPVKITGDIFLLERPKVTAIQLKKTDRPAWLNNFMHKYHSRNGISLIRCFYGEEPKKRFEIFFKTEEILTNVDTLNKDKFFEEEFSKKYKKILHQVIPHSLKHIIYLDDEGSKAIAESIKKDRGLSISPISSKALLAQSTTNDDEGAVLVICSCLVTGNSLLYVNKYLRRFKNMSRTFLIVFARTENESIFDFTKSNLGMGDLGVNTNQVVVIEKTACSHIKEDPTELHTLSWSVEIDLLKKLIALAEQDQRFKNVIPYLKERLSTLENAPDIQIGGLINNVFLKNPINNRILKINRSFAFFDFEEYHGNASQADIFFTISSVINNLRHSANKERRIIQEEHIRTLLDPINFNRFDDGIIQAAILRTASPNELNYKLDRTHSLTMMNILIKMIDNHEDELSSEGLIEFLLGLATKKLKLHDLHLKQVTERIDLLCQNDVLRCFSSYIQREVCNK
jgi:hypothetical protein